MFTSSQAMLNKNQSYIFRGAIGTVCTLLCFLVARQTYYTRRLNHLQRLDVSVVEIPCVCV